MLFSSKNWGKIRPHEILPKIRLLNQKMNLIVEIFNVPLCYTMIVRAAFNKRLKIYFITGLTIAVALPASVKEK